MGLRYNNRPLPYKEELNGDKDSCFTPLQKTIRNFSLPKPPECFTQGQKVNNHERDCTMRSRSMADHKLLTCLHLQDVNCHCAYEVPGAQAR